MNLKTMFNPQETKADSYIHKIGLLCIVIFFAIVVLELSRRSAVQFTYLRIYGVQTSAEVVRVCDYNETCESSHLGRTAVEYTFEYMEKSHLNRTSAIFGSGDIRLAYGSQFKAGRFITVIYDPTDQYSIIPKKLHENMETERNIAIGSILAILFCFLTILYQIRQYRRFKESMRYY